jgi:hypothetical protein
MYSGVVTTVHSEDAQRAIKVIKRADGRFGFNEFRREPEDAGGWTLVREDPAGTFATPDQAVAAARAGWLQAFAPPVKE